MEEENKFEEDLKAGVKEDSNQRMQALMEERENIIRSLEDKKVIDYDPKETAAMKKRLDEINKKIEEAEISAQEENVEPTEEEKDDKDEDITKPADKKKENEAEKQEEVVDDPDEDITKPSTKKPIPDEEISEEEKLKEEYHKALQDLYKKKQATIQKQINNHELVSSEEDYRMEVKMEGELYAARDKYLQLGKSDPYRTERTALIEKEKRAKEPIEHELRERARKFRELEEELRKIDKEEQKINEKLQNPQIKDTEVAALKSRLNELGNRREKVETELAEIKDGLNEAIETRQRRTIQRAGLEREYIETLSQDDMKNYTYQQEKVSIMNNNTEKANDQEYNNIAKRIAEREQRIEQINKELNEVDETDFERRIELLDTLDRETAMLEADREAKSDLDRGVAITEDEQKLDAKEKNDGEIERQEDFVASTDDARAAVEKVKKEEGERAVEEPHPDDPSATKGEARDEIEAVAVAGITSDNIVEGAVTYGAVRAIQDMDEEESEEKDPLKKQLKSQTYSKDEIAKKDAEMIESNERADAELDKVQDNLQSQTR